MATGQTADGANERLTFKATSLISSESAGGTAKRIRTGADSALDKRRHFGYK